MTPDRPEKSWKWRLARRGALFGAMAPVGWALLRLVLFGEGLDGAASQLAGDVLASQEQIALYLYMGLGTTFFFGLFGYLFGGAYEKAKEQAFTLQQLNGTVAEQKEQLERQLETLNEKLKNFHISNSHLQKSLDRRRVMHLAADSLQNILGFDRVNVLLLNPEKRLLEFIVSRGTEDENVSGITLPFDERAGILFKAIEENRICLVEDMRRMPADYHLLPPCDSIKQLRSRSFIICPVVLNGKAIGLFGVDNKRGRKALSRTDVETVRLFANQVSSALTKIALLEAVETLIAELEKTFAGLLEHREKHFDLIRSLRTSMAATAENTGRIAASSEAVHETVEETSSATLEISASIEEVSGRMSQLNEFVDNTVSAITEINATNLTVEKSARDSEHLSKEVRRHAENGQQMIDQTSAGLREIAQEVASTSRGVADLEGQSREVEQVIGIINEINQRTNLLSLNASIIAAQAGGEEGRSFAVVAEEIRSLSLETGRSAAAIEQSIADIRSTIDTVVKKMTSTRTLVASGIELSKGAEEALATIREAAARAEEMTREIGRATEEQVQTSQMVSRSTEELGSLSEEVARAFREQTGGLQRIVQAIEGIKEMTEEAATVNKAQEQETRRIDREVDSVGEMARLIFEEIGERQNDSRTVIGQLQKLKELNEKETQDGSLLRHTELSATGS